MEKIKNLFVLNRRNALITISLSVLYFDLSKLKASPFITKFEVNLEGAANSLNSKDLRSILNLEIDPLWYKNYEEVRANFIKNGQILKISKKFDFNSGKAIFLSHWASKQALKDFYKEAKMQILLKKLEQNSVKFNLLKV